MSLSKRIISFVMLFSISLTSILPSFNILNAQKEEKAKENVEEQNTNSFSSEAFEPIKFEKSKRSKRSVDILELEDYIRENLKTDIVENNILEKFQKKDALTVTTTVIDGTLLPNATLKDLNKDENKDNIQDNYKAIANQTTSNIPLFEVSKESKYLVGKVIGKLQNAKVTDIAFAKNNANAQILNDIIFDKETSLVYVPKTYTEKPLSVRTQIIVTTDEKPTKAKSEINVFVENKNIKDILVKTSKAYGNLQSVSTDIVLQEKEAKEKLTEEKIDSIEINKVKFTKEDKAYKYDEKERKLILFVSPVGVTEVKINLSKTVLKSAKNTLNKLASIFSKKSFAANVDGVMKMQKAPEGGEEYILTAEVKHHTNMRGASGYTNPLVLEKDLNEGDFETKTGKRVRGDWGFDPDDLKETSISLTRSAYIEKQTVDGVDFPEMSLNLVCSHIEVDSFESDLWSNAKLMIKAIRGDEVVVGVLTPTVYAQAGAGFFRIKWKKKIPPTKAYIKKIGVKGETIANAKFEMSYTKDFSDSNQKWSYTTGSDGLTEKDEWNVIGKTVYVREISVPKPYIKTNEVKTFVVGSSPMIKLTFINKKAPERLKGKLKIAKVGDVLEKYTEEKVTVKGKDYVVKKPKFKKSYIKGATFYIKQNGKVIKTVTSKTDLLEIVLPLGKYQVVEKQAPDGYIKSEKIYDVDLTKNQDIKTLEIKNEREKVKLNLTKSFEKGIFKKETWAVFGLFTKEKQNGLEKDTLIEVLDFDKENSSKEFKNTIKGKYYIKELNNSSGYRKYEKTYDIDFSFEKVASKTIINKLKRGGIQILKVDKNNKEIKLSSVEFKLLANNEKRTEIATKTTNKDGIATFENLELGEYILIETKTKEGYILDTKEKIIRVKEDNKITMETIENQPTKVVISKVGKDNPEKQLEGAEFEIIEVEDEEKEKKSTEISNKKEINPKVLSLLDDKFKFLLKKENLLKEDLEKLL